MSNSMTLSQVKTKLIRILNKLYPTYQLTEDSIRIWKSNMTYYTVEKMVEFLRSNHIGGLNTQILANDPENPDIENNTGVEFPGM